MCLRAIYLCATLSKSKSTSKSTDRRKPSKFCSLNSNFEVFKKFITKICHLKFSYIHIVERLKKQNQKRIISYTANVKNIVTKRNNKKKTIFL